MKTVRQQMLAGERPEACKVCWQLEDAGIQSSRQSAFAELRDLGVRPVNYQSERPPVPQSLELRLGHFATCVATVVGVQVVIGLQMSVTK